MIMFTWYLRTQYDQVGPGTWDPLSGTWDRGAQNFQVGPRTVEVGRQ